MLGLRYIPINFGAKKDRTHQIGGPQKTDSELGVVSQVKIAAGLFSVEAREPTSLYHSALRALCVATTSPTSFKIVSTIFVWSPSCSAQASCARRFSTSCVADRRVGIKAKESRRCKHCHLGSG